MRRFFCEDCQYLHDGWCDMTGQNIVLDKPNECKNYIANKLVDPNEEADYSERDSK